MGENNIFNYKCFVSIYMATMRHQPTNNNQQNPINYIQFADKTAAGLILLPLEHTHIHTQRHIECMINHAIKIEFILFLLLKFVRLEIFHLEKKKMIKRRKSHKMQNSWKQIKININDKTISNMKYSNDNNNNKNGILITFN